MSVRTTPFRTDIQALRAAAIALVVYVLAGVLYVVVSGQPIDVQNLVPTIAIFTTGGTVAYQPFWENPGDPQIQAKLAP